MVFNDSVENIFSIQIFKFNVGSLDDNLKKAIGLLNFVPSSDNFMSFGENILLQPSFANLKVRIYNNLKKFLYEVICVDENVKFKISDSWIYVTKPNGESHFHSHGNSFLSGVVYLNVNEGDCITFKNPLYSNSASTNHMPLSIFPQLKNNKMFYTFFPKNGDSIIFHSTVEHRVEKNNSKNDRVSLAFNVVPTGDISKLTGSKLSYNEIGVETIDCI